MPIRPLHIFALAVVKCQNGHAHMDSIYFRDANRMGVIGLGLCLDLGLAIVCNSTPDATYMCAVHISNIHVWQARCCNQQVRSSLQQPVSRSGAIRIGQMCFVGH